MHFDPADVARQLDASLEALRTDYVDLLQCTRPRTASSTTDGLWAALQHEQARGRVRHLGISISPPTNIYQTERALSVGAGTIQVRLQPACSGSPKRRCCRRAGGTTSACSPG